MTAAPSAPARFFLAVFLLQTSAYFVPPATWNPVSRFALTRAIVEDGSFELGPFADATGDRARVGASWFSEKSPWPSLVAVPAYALTRGLHLALGRPAPAFEASSQGGIPAVRVTVNKSFSQLLYVCAVAAGAVPFSLLGVLLLGFLSRRFSSPAAMGGALLVMGGTLLLPYSTSFYGHELAACAIFSAATVLDTALVHRRTLVAVGALLGLAVVTEYLALWPALGVAVAAVRRGASGRARLAHAGVLLLGAVGPALVLAGYNTACFGAPWRTGYSFVTLPLFVAGHARGFMGISWPSPSALVDSLFGASRGLFVLCPVAALGGLGLVGFLRERRSDPLVLWLAVGLLALLVVNSGYYMWWGGASTGPRHLVPGLPVLGVGIAWCLSRPGLRALTVVTGAFSCLVMVGFCAVGVEAPESGAVLTEYLWPRLSRGAIAQLAGASNLAVLLGLSPAASLGPMLAWWCVGVRGLLVASLDSRFDRL